VTPGLAAESLRRPRHEEHQFALVARTTSKGTRPAVTRGLDGNEVRWGTSKDKLRMGLAGPSRQGCIVATLSAPLDGQVLSDVSTSRHRAARSGPGLRRYGGSRRMFTEIAMSSRGWHGFVTISPRVAIPWR
jgi:hypothetical protein